VQVERILEWQQDLLALDKTLAENQVAAGTTKPIATYRHVDFWF
jgi:hypothetical protein